MKLLVLQWSPIWQDTAASLSALETYLAEQLNEQSDAVDLLILPELFHSGFSMHPERFAESLEGEVTQWLSQLAVQYQLHIVAGVAQKKVRQDCHGQQIKFYNRALAFNPSGQQIGSYTKQKSFSYANEERVFTAGHQAEIININGYHFALFICYDLRFPELFRKVAKQVDGMIVIANWPDSRQMHWETLLKARAIENQCFVIGVNRTGQDNNDLNYAGGSCVLNPWGETTAYAGKEILGLSALIDPNDTQSLRQTYPFLQDAK